MLVDTFIRAANKPGAYEILSVAGRILLELGRCWLPVEEGVPCFIRIIFAIKDVLQFWVGSK